MVCGGTVVLGSSVAAALTPEPPPTASRAVASVAPPQVLQPPAQRQPIHRPQRRHLNRHQ